MAYSEEEDRQFYELAKNHPLTPAVLVEIHDALAIGNFEAKFAQTKTGSQSRLDLTIEALNIRASAFLKLVDSMDHQLLFARTLKEVEKTAWAEFAGFPLSQANMESPIAKAAWKRIRDRSDHWQVEGLRRLAQESQPPGQTTAMPRRGYREHIRAWMKSQGIESVPVAATRLGVSESTLKSIMSSRGQIRYGQDTLARVLKKIDFTGE